MPLNVTFDPPVLTLTPTDGARPRSSGDRVVTAPIDAEALLIEALAPAFTVAVESIRTESLTHLDTVDGRLQKAGIDLAHLPRRRRMVALTEGNQIEQPVTGSWPRLAVGAARRRGDRPGRPRRLDPGADPVREHAGRDDHVRDPQR